MRTYENFVIIPQSYIIPSFQVRKGVAPPLTPTKPLGRFWLKNQKEKIPRMAIYHLSTKPISRSSGRSAVASVAYRAGIEITDERLGKTYDYTKRSGVLWTGIATPNGIEINRNELWNLAEKTETRSNSRTAREIVINIPHELMSGDQSAGKMLAYEFATNLSQKYKIAVDVAVHAPDKQGDNRNYHAHLLLTTRQIEQSKDGYKLASKSQLEMSNTQLKKLGLLSNQDELKEIRKEWAELANTYLAEHGLNERIDHRSHKDRGLLTLPTVKMGWQATELERKGIKTDVGDHNRAIRAYNAQIEQRNELQQQIQSDTTKAQTKPLHAKSAKEIKAELVQITQNGYKDGTINNRNDLVAVLKERGYSVENKGDKIAISLPNSDQIVSLSGELFTNTLKNAPRNAVEPQKSKNGTNIPPTPKNTLKTQNRAIFSENLLSPEQHQQTLAFLKGFHDRLEQIAQNILENKLKALRTKAKPILATFEKLRDNEPLFFGKDQWQQDKQKALNAYNAVKEQHDTMKANGITDEHRKQANEQLAEDNPSYYEKSKQAFLSIKLHQLAELDNLAKQYGADKHARAGQTYRGKIIQSDGKMSLQQTQDGIVLHRVGNLTVGKGYTLSHNDKTYSIQQDYEIRTKNQDKQQDKGKGFGE